MPGNAVDSARRATRAEREGYMVGLVKSSKEGVEIDKLYGYLTKRWPGLSYRTYTSEYLKAAKARGDIHYKTSGKGTFVIEGENEEGV
jgi:hypothetical protein